jgi:hypothetical protein
MVLDSRREDGQTQQKENPTPLTSLCHITLCQGIHIYKQE